MARRWAQQTRYTLRFNTPSIMKYLILFEAYYNYVTALMQYCTFMFNELVQESKHPCIDLATGSKLQQTNNQKTTLKSFNTNLPPQKIYHSMERNLKFLIGANCWPKHSMCLFLKFF